MKLIKTLAVITSFSTLLSGASIQIATGSKSGNYYKMGEDIKRVCDSLSIKVKDTKGSVQNISLLLKDDSDIDFAIVQTDALLSKELSLDIDNSIKDKISTLLPLNREVLYLLTREGSNISRFSDLSGKRVLVGIEGSGSKLSARFLMSYFDAGYWELIEGDTSDITRLSNEEVDAIFFVGSYPYPNLKRVPNGVVITNFDQSLGKPFKEFLIEDGKVRVFSQNSLLVGKSESPLFQKLKTCVLNNLQRLQSDNRFSPQWKDVNPDIDFYWYSK
jgi:TRAP transporter TAXI family solute receptor